MRIDFPDGNGIVNIPNKTTNDIRGTTKTSFSDILNKNLNEVNQLLLDSNEWNEKLALGQVENVHQVIIATQKAELALQFTMQIRNKILDAYNEIMRMTV